MQAYHSYYNIFAATKGNDSRVVQRNLMLKPTRNSPRNMDTITINMKLPQVGQPQIIGPIRHPPGISTEHMRNLVPKTTCSKNVFFWEMRKTNSQEHITADSEADFGGIAL